mmetsp:Transcript_133415/g.426509  ORF Transcript_133415/g.426509 Transcript_133415/m.426509 type:complete len:218 (-) Transcript_133415:468-1121(-)
MSLAPDGPTVSCSCSALPRSLTQLAEGIRVADGDAHHTCEGVAETNGDPVLQDHLCHRDVRSHHNACRDQEHVGHRVLHAHRHEGRDGEPDADHLAAEVAGRLRQEHRHADHPVAHDGLDERLAKAHARLGHGGRDGELLGASHQKAGVECGSRQGAATQDVAENGNSPTPRQIAHGGLALEDGHGHRCGVVCKELPTADQDEKQVHRKECAKDHLL